MQDRDRKSGPSLPSLITVVLVVTVGGCSTVMDVRTSATERAVVFRMYERGGADPLRGHLVKVSVSEYSPSGTGRHVWVLLADCTFDAVAYGAACDKSQELVAPEPLRRDVVYVVAVSATLGGPVAYGSDVFKLDPDTGRVIELRASGDASR